MQDGSKVLYKEKRSRTKEIDNYSIVTLLLFNIKIIISVFLQIQ